MRCSLLVFMGLALAGTAPAVAGDITPDAAAGKAKADQICATCHEPADWKGKSETELQAKISDVVAGKTKHKKKIELSGQEIADIAAYWSSASK